MECSAVHRPADGLCHGWSGACEQPQNTFGVGPFLDHSKSCMWWPQARCHVDGLFGLLMCRLHVQTAHMAAVLRLSPDRPWCTLYVLMCVYMCFPHAWKACFLDNPIENDFIYTLWEHTPAVFRPSLVQETLGKVLAPSPHMPHVCCWLAQGYCAVAQDVSWEVHSSSLTSIIFLGSLTLTNIRLSMPHTAL